MRILADIGRDDTVDRMTHCIELRDELERAVADLLKQIGGAVGNVHLGVPRRLVDAGGVALEPERLPTTHHRADHRELDRKSVVEGKSVSVRVDLGGSRVITKKKQTRD